MKGIKVLVLATASAAAFAAAATAMGSVAIPMGWYIEGNAGNTRIGNVNYGSTTSVKPSGLGWNVNGGYKFMPYFAVEAGYTAYAKGRIKSNGTVVANSMSNAYYLAGRAILPVSDSGFDFFAKIGMARIRSHVVINNMPYLNANGISLNSGTFNATGAYFGFGADYNFMPNMAVNAQWNRAKGNSSTGNLDLYGLGLTYTFD